ncbi:hypothetical protein Tco_0277402 [Tanacetum coccineum]
MLENGLLDPGFPPWWAPSLLLRKKDGEHGAYGIIMDPSKVEAITKWPRPTTVTELPIIDSSISSGGFQIYSDALRRKLGGCVLMQHGEVDRPTLQGS